LLCEIIIHYVISLPAVDKYLELRLGLTDEVSTCLRSARCSV